MSDSKHKLKYKVTLTKRLPFNEYDVMGVLNDSLMYGEKIYRVRSIEHVVDLVNAIFATASDSNVKVQIEKI
jgi:methenyltetrahydromethanopterin cyclohydrolase